MVSSNQQLAGQTGHFTSNFSQKDDGNHMPQQHNQMGTHHQQQQHDPRTVQHHQLTGLDVLAQGSQYALQQLHDQNQYHQSTTPSSHNRESSGNGDDDSGRHRQDGSGAMSTSKSAGGPVRRRISRACDQCNQLRTKCDGKNPCAHCVEFALACEYNREKKKRGKASRRDMEKQGRGPNSITQDSPKSVAELSPVSSQTMDVQPSLKRRRSSDHAARRDPPPQNQGVTNGFSQPSAAAPEPRQPTSGLGSMSASDHYNTSPMPMTTPAHMLNTLPSSRLSSGMSDRGNPHYGGLGDFNGSVDDYHRQALQHSGQHLLHGAGNTLPMPITSGAPMMGYGDPPFGIGQSPQSQSGLNGYRIAQSPMSAGQPFIGASPNAGSPGWLQLPSPSPALFSGNPPQLPGPQLRYPVLKPILSRISAIIPPGLACDLLELYFASPYSSFSQPSSPYILGFFLRKRSFLRQHNPRQCSPALLASILWVAAQTSDAPFLTSPPSARGRICRQLFEVTVNLLRPLIHTPAEGLNAKESNPVVNGVALGGFGVSLHAARHDNEGGNIGAAGTIDDVATYINLATVVSASEYKGASLRWWTAAWGLARELKLGRELPPNPETSDNDSTLHNDGDDTVAGANPDLDMSLQSGQTEVHARQGNMRASGVVSEEEREERRRIWWLLYIVDRHLGLCYNRSLCLRDAECKDLLQPEDDVIFQAGDYYSPSETQQTDPFNFRRLGMGTECTGHGIFGYFLPLMVILGGIVDLKHSRDHPHFGVRLRNGSADLEDQQNMIRMQLDAYGRSLEAFKQRFVPSSADASSDKDSLNPGAAPSYGATATTTAAAAGTRITEPVLLTKIIVSYGTYLMHTLHILLNGRWDPITLLDDDDLWISSPGFVVATGHAVSAAKAISGILDYDPDLSYMPFFLGIYLLQGSFLLLLIADKLGGEAKQDIVEACETIVRAHEVCVVTLNTEYQRNFRKVMRSALQQVRGRTIEDPHEQQLRRRETLALYRWINDGTGLAL